MSDLIQYMLDRPLLTHYTSYVLGRWHGERRRLALVSFAMFLIGRRWR